MLVRKLYGKPRSGQGTTSPVRCSTLPAAARGNARGCAGRRQYPPRNDFHEDGSDPCGGSVSTPNPPHAGHGQAPRHQAISSTPSPPHADSVTTANTDALPAGFQAASARRTCSPLASLGNPRLGLSRAVISVLLVAALFSLTGVPRDAPGAPWTCALSHQSHRFSLA